MTVLVRRVISRYLLSIVIGNAFLFSTAYDAEVSGSQQALEQLRMLQNKLAPSTNSKMPSSKKSDNMNNDERTSPLLLDTNPPAANSNNNALITKAPSTNVSNNAPIPSSTTDNEEINKEAFKKVLDQIFPLSPEEIIRLKQKYQTMEFAQSSTAGTPPKPMASSQFVNLSPGSTPPVIRLAQGFVSSLVFLDSTGAPWPISAYDLGDPAAFNIQWDKSGNTLMIQAMKLYTYGNLAVRLQGLNTPVMLTLIPGQKAVDYRIDLRVQGLGPNAKGMQMEELPSSASDLLLHVLEGVPPDGSTRLTVSGGDARGWLLNDHMYIRTNLTILSPGWIGSMTSADGMHAYEMQKAPVILVSWHGKVMQLKVEGL